MGGRCGLLVRFGVIINVYWCIDSNPSRYTWANIFATQIVAAASFTEYWNLAQVYQTVLFCFVAPFSILFINFAGVFVRHLVLDSPQIA